MLNCAAPIGVVSSLKGTTTIGEPPLREQSFPTPFDPQWSHFNRRRAQLIRRKVRSGLSAAEEEELSYLQKETLAAVEKAFPRPPVNIRLIASIEERLKNAP
jgi:hypothetical protein